MNKCLLSPFIWILAILITTCSNQDSSGNKPSFPNAPVSSRNTSSSENDSLITGKNELVKVYSQAITAYIAAVYKREQTDFDTLFIGKQADFPDIDLPATIKSTRICILYQENITNHKAHYRKSSPYINLIGFVDHNEAEFIFITFYPEFMHQYDCYMNFRYNTSKKEFEVDKLRIEVLIRNTEGMPAHYAVYEDGKYVGDKPIK